MAISYATLKVTLEVIVEVEHDADGSDNIGATLTEAVSEAKSASKTVDELGKAAREIGKVTDSMTTG